MIQGAGKTNLAKVSPFTIAKSLANVAGQIKSVQKTKGGALFVEVEQAKQARSLLEMTNLTENIKVEVSPHRSLNSSRGVIRWRDLLGTPVEEIKQELSGQGVTHVHQMKLKKGGNTIELATYILTFDRSTPPKELRCGYQVVKVEDYIPSPMRCFKCQRFGHLGKRCNRQAVCGKCAKQGHTFKDCKEKKPSCANCKGDHPSFSRKCPLYLEEKEVQSLKSERKISIPEARKVVRASRAPVLPKSFAAAVANKVSVGTQTCAETTEPQAQTASAGTDTTEKKKRKRKRKNKKKKTEDKEEKKEPEPSNPGANPSAVTPPVEDKGESSKTVSDPQPEPSTSGAAAPVVPAPAKDQGQSSDTVTVDNEDQAEEVKRTSDVDDDKDSADNTDGRENEDEKSSLNFRCINVGK